MIDSVHMFGVIKKPSRLWHTLSPLKPIQFGGLFYYRVLRRFAPFDIPTVEPQSFETISIKFPRYQPVSWLGERRFLFLNKEAEVADNWEASNESLLWHYNLYYFDYLNSIGQQSSKDQLALISDWWLKYAPKQGVAWDAYPTSLRTVNLCKWYGQHQLSDTLNWSLIFARHYCEIKRKLEFHLQANHLFANLKALWFLQAIVPAYRNEDGVWLCRQLTHELD